MTSIARGDVPKGDAARRAEELRRKSREWRDPNDPDWCAHHDEENAPDPSDLTRDD